ncbi:MAG: hypothetical protein KGL45_04925 [Gammaproteobacteria bacterium]|nr:hypothetical protein [Gammaproteobacteria bacterium]
MAAAVAMADQPLESRVARLESDVAHIRSDVAEIKLDIRELRDKVIGIDKALREQMVGMDKDLRAEIGGLRDSLTRGLASNRIWMLLQSAAILGVMARGFKWL